MVAAFWRSRAAAGGDSGASTVALDADLRKIINSGVIDLPKELRDPIVEASKEEAARKMIMKHLQDALAEPKAPRWRRIHAALILTEDLFAGEAEELLTETAAGLHFDIIQRLALLERFEAPYDRKAQQIVRAKAQQLRVDILPRLQGVDPSQAPALDRSTTPSSLPEKDSSAELIRDTASVGSLMTEGTCSTAASVPSSSPVALAAKPQPRKQAGNMVLGGVVRIGHHDDTTSESSGAEDAAKRASRQATRKTARERNEAHNAPPTAPTTGLATNGSHQAQSPQAPSADMLGDMLDLMGEPERQSQPQAALPAAAATTANLLDF